MTTIKTISIETLAEKLNGKLWIKEDLKRIYLDAGYNTKKMSTKTYVFEKAGSFIVVCDVECANQPAEWCTSQENEVIEYISGKIAEIIEEFGFETEDPKTAIQAELDAQEQVQGYYMRWRDVKVAINSYGKLAIRKRQFVHTYKGAISKVPTGFINLNDADFSIALEKEMKEIAYEYGCEPEINGMAKRLEDAAEQKEKQLLVDVEAAKLNDAKEAELKKRQAIEIANKIAELKANGFDTTLLAWKESGCPHPAPAKVVDAKNASGLNWGKFTETIN